MQKEGKKNDKKDDKTRWELMPLDCLEDIARVYTEGAKKYGENTWQNLENGYQRYKAALLRHLWEFEKGMNTEEKLDKILLNQQVILLYLRQILQDTNRSQFLEDYAANLAAQATEIILGHNIVRK
jgi:hypothetical protein